MNNPHIEQNAIAKILNDQSPEMLARIDDECFGNQDLKNIFKLIQKFYLDNGCFPGWDVLTGNVVKLCKTKEKADFLSSLLLQIRDRDIQGLTDDMLLKELQEYKQLRKGMLYAGKIVSCIENKDAASFKAVLQEAHDTIFVSSEYKIDDSDASCMLGKPIEFKFKKTGIEKIDERGGLIQGGLTILGGEAKAGKSILAEQIGLYNYVNYDSSVAMLSYEQGVDELRARMIANYADLDLGDIIAKRACAEDILKSRWAQIDLFFQSGGRDVWDFCKSCAKLEDDQFSIRVNETFKKRENKFFLFRETLNWDDLFIKMGLLARTRGVKLFILDYPWLVPDGKIPFGESNWQYKLNMIQRLKTFSHDEELDNMITPAQYDSTGDKLKFISNAVNACDLYASMNNKSKEDAEFGTVTVTMKAYRNYLTIPDKPTLEPFRLLKDFSKGRFLDFNF